MRSSSDRRNDPTHAVACVATLGIIWSVGSGQNNGKWYVDRTTHTFDAGGYHVNFELIRNAAAGDETSSDHILAGVL